ncbi:MAG: DUF1002 domain-containing protein [Lachnospiraceae bacterium]|jgi:uncharacterized protein YpuA (DUF1002 family)|uniref:DUF1002 domain-containing protein n=1 Tax=Hominisplanchenecus murintestinalis TaxID=2941517 RepID=A0AC61R2F8_9FIRM|nr:DUF1002 domain-containing protein [Hominisplanchenecus murintestinalis]MCI9517221.1 DUF1002 domain-containing protein [Lachnospiraceae bacterium]RKJ81987.1 DUF1002 domain-containing protein [Anaerotruncus sp. 1XD22-93]MCI9661757.1 DUF1002 domain-containing protein [Lachnospiraceae bacterium]NBH99093.1 DUF1002 domain-containing protein [Lachnospiraceae bacterium]NBI76324.1 DUF1002 domain-containing protein [Lachnospiraceae bacterium]
MGKKQMLTGALAACMFLTSGMTALADRVDAVIDKPYVALGADLKESERAKVLELLGVTEAELKDYDVVTITNEDEHKYLDSYLDAGVIGTRALSSVMVVGKEAGNGINVNTNNISYCTSGMYRNALITAGVEDADITVAGPFSISGTAALVGAIKAYETMTGEEVPEVNLDAANNELVITGEIVESVGDPEKVEQLMALVKQEVAEGAVSGSEDIKNLVKQAADELEIRLSDEDRDKITGLMDKIDGLDLNVDAIKEQAKDLYHKLENLDFNFDAESVGNFFTRIIDAIVGFFQDLFS